MSDDGDRCEHCGAPLAADQRYCLECGERRGSARLDVLSHARGDARPGQLDRPSSQLKASREGRAVGLGLGEPRVGALLFLAMLVVGVALGAAAGPNVPPSLAMARPRPLSLMIWPGPAAQVADPIPEPVAVADATPGPTPTPDMPFAEVSPIAANRMPPAPREDATPADTPDTVPEPVSSYPSIKHVWVVMLHGVGFNAAWKQDPVAPHWMADQLRPAGVLLTEFHSVAHGTAPGGIALLSGQGPNPATLAGCGKYAPVEPGTTSAADEAHQVLGTGCVFPPRVPTLPDQLTGAGMDWRAYVESVVGPDVTACSDPDDGVADPRNPFLSFASITRDGACRANVVGLDQLDDDLADPARTPAFSYLVPGTCHDGRDGPCAEGAPGGLPAAELWLRETLSKITTSKAYKRHGLVVVTSDEGAADDSTACRCAPKRWPNVPAGTTVGGGKVGALLLSPFARAGTTNDSVADQITLLRTIEDIWGLSHLGAADLPDRVSIDPAVFR